MPVSSAPETPAPPAIAHAHREVRRAGDPFLGRAALDRIDEALATARKRLRDVLFEERGGVARAV